MKFVGVIGSTALFLMLGMGANLYGQHDEKAKEEKPEGKAAPQQRAQPQQHAQQPKPQARPAEPKAQPREQPVERAQPAQRAQQAKPPAQPPKAQAQQPKTQAQPPAQRAPAQHQQARQQSKPSAAKASYAPPQRTRQQAQTWQQQSSWRQDGAWQEHASWQQDGSANWQADHRTWAQRGGYGGYFIPQASFNLHFGIGNWFRIGSQPIIVGGYPRFQYGGYTFMMVDPWPDNWTQNWYSADDVYVGYDNGYYLYNRAYPGEALAITVVL
jgi:hypothetical protein